MASMKPDNWNPAEILFSTLNTRGAFNIDTVPDQAEMTTNFFDHIVCGNSRVEATLVLRGENRTVSYRICGVDDATGAPGTLVILLDHPVITTKV